MLRRLESMLAWAALVLTASPTAAASPAGAWLMQNGKAEVMIAPCGQALCGRVSRVIRYPRDGARTDAHNGDPRLRSRPLVGLPVLLDFRKSGSDWTGRVYDPKSGRTYKAYLSQDDPAHLNLKACILIVCKSQRWTRLR